MVDFFKAKKDKNEGPQDEQKLTEGLEFLETVLNEEDPGFIQSIGDIKIEAEDVPESSAEDVLAVDDNNVKHRFFGLISLNENSLLKNFLKPFLIHKYPKQVLAFWILVLGLGFAVVKVYQSQFWSKPTKLFLTSFADFGVTVNDYDMLNEVEPFYDNVRFSKNLISLTKMTANIRPSENSTNNPMISFELVLQGVSNEPIVEIKDREAEFRDIALRVVEEFSYDDLETASGKQNLSEAILARVNANLTDGQIRKVYYKNFVLKP